MANPKQIEPKNELEPNSKTSLGFVFGIRFGFAIN